jgi:hypothetical protein
VSEQVTQAEPETPDAAVTLPFVTVQTDVLSELQLQLDAEMPRLSPVELPSVYKTVGVRVVDAPRARLTVLLSSDSDSNSRTVNLTRIGHL